MTPPEITAFNASSILHPGSLVWDSLTTTIVPDIGLGGVGIKTLMHYI